MTVIRTTKDADALTMTFVADLDASVDRVWKLWQDPRQLEQWWGPPTWPATFDRHDFVVGGQSRYHMTGPDGERAPGWWRITAMDAPRRLELVDGFSLPDGEPDPTQRPITAVVTAHEVDGKTRMAVVTHFVDSEHLEQMLAMGMDEGLVEAMGQIDPLLATGPAD